MIWWIYYPPNVVTDGDPVDTAGIVIFVGLALAMFFTPLWYNPSGNNSQSGRFRLPTVLGGRTDEEEERIARTRTRNSQERRALYQERLRGRR